MNIINTKANYGIISIVLHWLMAVLIIGSFIIGQYMVDLDYYDPWYHSAPWWHKSIGIIILALLLFRLIWKLTHIVPEPLQTYKAWEVKVAGLVHLLFYMMLLLACLSGYFISTANGAGIEVFTWLELPAIIKLDESQSEIAGDIHEIVTNILFMLFFIHVSAVLKHHFIDKDMTLIRMLKINLKDNFK